MTINDFLRWVIEHKEYAPLYSALVATGAFVFSIISFGASRVWAKKERKTSDVRYVEQQRLYEERLNEERQRREEDKKLADERIRKSEQPYLVFKLSGVCSCSNSKLVSMRFVFENKGRGSAYAIQPDLDFWSSMEDEGVSRLRRSDIVKNSVVRVGEEFEILCVYDGPEKQTFETKIVINFENFSGCRYIQNFYIVVYDNNGNSVARAYSNPILQGE